MNCHIIKFICYECYYGLEVEKTHPIWVEPIQVPMEDKIVFFKVIFSIFFMFFLTFDASSIQFQIALIIIR